MQIWCHLEEGEGGGEGGDECKKKSSRACSLSEARGRVRVRSASLTERRSLHGSGAIDLRVAGRKLI